MGPLRSSRDFRLLWFGELVSLCGRQITVVALPFQVYLLTRSSLAVGLIGLAQFVPLILFSTAGGALVDRVDRRKVIVATEIGMAITSVMLLAGAIAGRPPLWYLYLATGLEAGLSGVNWPARSAAVPNYVSRQQLPAALALNQVLFNSSMLVGPALGGIILGRLGLEWAYGIDVVTYTAAVAAALLIRPLRPQAEPGHVPKAGWQALREGFGYLRGKRVLISTFLIDLDAMIFGMPRALFPVLALTVFEVGPTGLGLLYAAPAAGALIGAVTGGWIGNVSRQGRAVVWAVVLWGLAIVGFGMSSGFFWLALAFLAFAGAADVVSAVFRATILQVTVPDALRGRLSAVHIMVVTGGPRLGDVESGLVASLVSPLFAVVSGGVACVLGALALSALIPELWRYRGPAPDERQSLSAAAG